MKAFDILQSWIAKINAGDVEGAVAMYAASASLIPTFSARTLTKREDLRRYFTSLAARPQISVSLHEKSYHEQAVTETVYVLSGIYAFRFELDEDLLTFEARFTYVVDITKDAPILHHHSSQIPRALG